MLFQLRHFLGLDLDVKGTRLSKCIRLRDYKPVPFSVHCCHMFTYVIAISCYSQLKVETLESMNHNRICCNIESVLPFVIQYKPSLSNSCYLFHKS